MNNKDLYKSDVLFWADLCPQKRGSFEDYICTLAQKCAEKNLKIHFVFKHHPEGSVKYLFNNVSYDVVQKGILPIMKIILKIRPKVIHFNFVSFCSPAVLIGRLARVKSLIFSDHSSSSNTGKRRATRLALLRRIKGRLYGANIDLFIAVSAYIAERLKKTIRIPGQKVKIIYNGVNLERFHPSLLKRTLFRKEMLENTKFRYIVSYIGQLIAEKGIYVFLDSAKRISKKHPEVLFLIAGEGPEMDSLKKITEKTLMSNVRFLGMRNDIEAVLNASDVFVCPSLWHEAFGLVIAEAMACGVPVVGSGVGAIPEIIKDRKTGLIVSPNKSDELATAIINLLREEEMRRTLGRAGQKFAVENFSLNRMVSETITLYERELSAANRSQNRDASGYGS